MNCLFAKKGFVCQDKELVEASEEQKFITMPELQLIKALGQESDRIYDDKMDVGFDDQFYKIIKVEAKSLKVIVGKNKDTDIGLNQIIVIFRGTIYGLTNWQNLRTDADSTLINFDNFGKTCTGC